MSGEFSAVCSAVVVVAIRRVLVCKIPGVEIEFICICDITSLCNGNFAQTTTL